MLLHEYRVELNELDCDPSIYIGCECVDKSFFLGKGVSQPPNSFSNVNMHYINLGYRSLS
jgi:hypothetical protein